MCRSHHLDFCGFCLLFAIVSDRSPPPASLRALFQISTMHKQSNCEHCSLSLKSVTTTAYYYFLLPGKGNIIWSCFAFYSYVQTIACTVGGLVVLSSSIVLLCIGQDKRFLGQTGGTSQGTWTFSISVKLMNSEWEIWFCNSMQSQISSLSLLGFMCPLVPIASNLLHHRQFIPAYEPRVRNIAYNHLFFCSSFMQNIAYIHFF